MNGWTKYFADGTQLVGDDESVRQGRASWRRSQAKKVVAVKMEHDGAVLHLIGHGPWWQSDGYESVFPGPGTTLVKRRIQCQLSTADSYLRLYRANSQSLTIAVNQDLANSSVIRVPKSWHGKWLTLEYDVGTMTTTYRVADSEL